MTRAFLDNHKAALDPVEGAGVLHWFGPLSCTLGISDRSSRADYGHAVQHVTNPGNDSVSDHGSSAVVAG